MSRSNDLLDRLQSRSIVLRVHDSSSISPYVSGEGFTASSGTFHDISKSQFRKRFGGLRYAYGWKNSSETAGSMVRHILGGWNGWTRYTNGYSEPSSWISTSADLEWAIYEISRRLAKNTSGNGHCQLSVIRTYKPKVRGVGIHVSTQLNDDEGGDEGRALDFARASSEILWYGRIWDEDVEQVMVWTAKVSCLSKNLPWGSSIATDAYLYNVVRGQSQT